jgi:hypothetical protein
LTAFAKTISTSAALKDLSKSAQSLHNLKKLFPSMSLLDPQNDWKVSRRAQALSDELDGTLIIGSSSSDPADVLRFSSSD